MKIIFKVLRCIKTGPSCWSLFKPRFQEMFWLLLLNIRMNAISIEPAVFAQSSGPYLKPILFGPHHCFSIRLLNVFTFCATITRSFDSSHSLHCLHVTVLQNVSLFYFCTFQVPTFRRKMVYYVETFCYVSPAKSLLFWFPRLLLSTAFRYSVSYGCLIWEPY